MASATGSVMLAFKDLEETLDLVVVTHLVHKALKVALTQNLVEVVLALEALEVEIVTLEVEIVTLEVEIVALEEVEMVTLGEVDKCNLLILA